MMNCRNAQRRLSDDLEGVLTTRWRRAVELHLGDCVCCRRLRDDMLAIGAEYQALAERLPIPDSAIEHRAIQRWDADRVLTSAPQVAPARWKPLCAGLGAVFLVAAVAFLSARRQPGFSVRRPQAAERDRQPVVRRLLPDQVIRALPPSPSPTDHRSGEQIASAPGASPDDLIDVDRARDTAPSPSAVGPRKTRDNIEKRARQVARPTDDFVQIPYPLLATTSDQQIQAAAERYKKEAAIVDGRLTRKVTLQLKATALADLCEQLRSDTGIQLAAGQSVADEKVTLFCRSMPLREVMRQLSRLFGYTWLRSGKEDAFRYELTQDLRSQLLEEELRNRDRNAALLALDREIQQYRPYLGLSPDEALARAETARPEEKKLLEQLAGEVWAPLQLLARLSPQEMAALRDRQKLTFSTAPRPGEQPLPVDIARGVLQSLREHRVLKAGETYSEVFGDRRADPEARPVGGIPDAGVLVQVSILPSELGQFMLNGGVGWFTVGANGEQTSGGTTVNNYFEGMGRSIPMPGKKMADAGVAHAPDLRERITLRPQPSCGVDPSPSPSPKRGGEQLPLSASGRGEGGGVDGSGELPGPKVTSADALEALYRATGRPIVADFYTRLCPRVAVSMTDQPLLEVLNHLSVAMRTRWRKEGTWLQFRSDSYFIDRLKEVPNRLLERWAADRRQHGALTLDDLVEIAQLSDAQLDAKEMAEGARECFGLREWRLASNGNLRRHLRNMAGFAPEQRQEAMSAAGLPFGRMSLAQQQRFLLYLLKSGDPSLRSLEEMAGAALQVEYRPPDLGFRYLPGTTSRRSIHWVNAQNDAYIAP
jgi:hypothetical protein